jgi:hypothetical protein
LQEIIGRHLKDRYSIISSFLFRWRLRNIAEPVRLNHPPSLPEFVKLNKTMVVRHTTHNFTNTKEAL